MKKKWYNPLSWRSGSKLKGSSITFVGSEVGWLNWMQSGVTKVNMIKDALLINPYVYALTTFTARKAAGIEFVAFKEKNKKLANRYKQMKFGKHPIIKQLPMRAKAFEELTDHPLLDLLNNPNPSQSKSEFIEYVVALMVVTGRGYIWKQRVGMGQRKNNVAFLVPLNPAQTERHMKLNDSKEVDRYETMFAGKNISIPPDDIIEISIGNVGDFNSPGRGVFESAGIVIRKSNNVNISEDSMISKGGMIGLFSMKEKEGAFKALTQAEREEFEEKFKEKTGVHNTGGVYLTGLDLKWEQVGFKPSEMNYKDARQASLRDLCACIGLAPQLFGDPESKTFDNMNVARRAAWTDVILPLLYRIKDSLIGDLTQEWYKSTGESIMIDFDEFSVPELQEDIKEMVQWLKDAYWLTINEKRAVLRYDPDTLDERSMQGYWIPSGLKHTSSLDDDSDISQIIAEEIENIRN